MLYKESDELTHVHHNKKVAEDLYTVQPVGVTDPARIRGDSKIAEVSAE